MTEITVSCDTVVRLSNVIATASDVDPAFQCIRFDNGVAVASDRRFMAIEKVADFAGIFYIIPSAVLIDQCRSGANFNATLTLVVNDLLRYTGAKTNMGYLHPGNVGYWSAGATDFDRWREIVNQSRQPAAKSVGGMYWEADSVARLAASSPSGQIVFEENIDSNRPTIVRDTEDHAWLGVFNPFRVGAAYQPASVPSWLLP